MKKKRRPSKRSANSREVSLQEVPGGGAWRLVHPKCARDRAEDLEEVRLMIDSGEFDVAEDELRWLLSGCSDCVDAHLLLGGIAVNHRNDVSLARGHFGYAYQLGLTAWRRAGEPTPVPFAQPANQTFFEAGRALAWCLRQLEMPEMAHEIVCTLLRLDPSDPLDVNSIKRPHPNGGLPILGQ